VDLHGSFGREIFDESLGEFVVDGAILVSHSDDLTGDAVAECVEPGTFLALFRGTCGQKGVCAIGRELLV
jgi:hypothetical protein